MALLRNRHIECTVNTTKLAGHRVAFSVEKTIKEEPNTCELQIWNLNSDQRSEFEELEPKKEAPRGIPVRIEAGYEDQSSLIWIGDLRTVDSVKDGADWVTTFRSGDGEKAYQTARIGQSFGPRTSLPTALRAIADALGIGHGNLAKVALALKQTGATSVFTHGKVLSGSAAQAMTDFARSADLEWSIQDGALQLVDRGKALAGLAIRLTSDTGMIDSPTVDNKGVLTVTMLMIPDVRPGSLLVLDSQRIKGNYRIEKANWFGDTHGNEWFIQAECSRY
jgi:hypothetical protein